MEVKPKLSKHNELTGNFVPDINEAFVSVPIFDTQNQILSFVVILIKGSKPTTFLPNMIQE